MYDRIKTLPAIRVVLLAFAVIALTGLAVGTISLFNRERSAPAMSISSAAAESPIPPIDAAAPNQTETATFALG